MKKMKTFMKAAGIVAFWLFASALFVSVVNPHVFNSLTPEAWNVPL